MRGPWPIGIAIRLGRRRLRLTLRYYGRWAHLNVLEYIGSQFLFLTRTKFGIAMRASVENPSLARVLGIDVERAYVFAWFLAGGFGATAGSFSVLWLQGGTTFGSGLIVEIFAASVLGGLASVYGAAFGGLIVGASEILLTQAGITVFGSWISIYQKGFPLLIMVITLL